MNNHTEQSATSIIAGIRDNLLKPMAAEIENSQKECCATISKHIEEQAKTLSGQITELKTKDIDDTSSSKIETFHSLLVLSIVLLLCNLSALVILIVILFKK